MKLEYAEQILFWNSGNFIKEVFGAVNTGGKRLQTPHRPNGKGGQGKGWLGKGGKFQASQGTYARSYLEMMRLLCRVRQEDMLNILKQSTSWVIFAKTESPSVIPGLVAASQKWKEEITKQDSQLGNVSLRTTLFWCLLSQLMETFKSLTADQLQKAKDAGWSTDQGQWVYEKWSPANQTLEQDATRAPCRPLS